MRKERSIWLMDKLLEVAHGFHGAQCDCRSKSVLETSDPLKAKDASDDWPFTGSASCSWVHTSVEANYSLLNQGANLFNYCKIAPTVKISNPQYQNAREFLQQNLRGLLKTTKHYQWLTFHKTAATPTHLQHILFLALCGKLVEKARFWRVESSRFRTHGIVCPRHRLADISKVSHNSTEDST